MVEYVVAPPARASVAVEGMAARFPVRRVYCVGRNYAAHAREMGSDPSREPPFFFMKPADAVIDAPATIPYPPGTADLQHEVELVVALGGGGADIPVERALDHVFGYAVGLDLTRRDLQAQAREAGRPWEWGKAFDRSAPCAALRPVAVAGHPRSGRIWLSVGGRVRQDGDLAEMIWPVADVVAAISRVQRLEPGDLIFTGTPAGVGPIASGDVVDGGIDGLGTVGLTIA